VVAIDGAGNPSLPSAGVTVTIAVRSRGK